MKLTKQIVAQFALPKGRSEIIVFDDDLAGFGLRIREGGSRTWIFQYKLGAKHRRISFGSADAMTVQAARERAERFHAQVKLGQDPAAQKSEDKAKAAETFEPLARKFLTFQKTTGRKKPLKPRTYLEVERHLLSHAKPLHGLPITAVDQRRVAMLLNDVAQNSGNITPTGCGPRSRLSLAGSSARG
jgi:hypothetical protein